MASGNVFDREERRQRRRRLFSRLQTGFTALLTVFFIGVSAWSVNSIIEQNREGGAAAPARQQVPAAKPAAQDTSPKSAPAPQTQRGSAGDWIVNAPN